MSDIPNSYRRCQRQEGFSEALGPFYETEQNQVKVQGMRIREWHCNPEGFAHGGVLASCADFAMYQAAGDRLGSESITPTVTMTCNYLAAARLGDWVIAEAKITRQTRSMLFIHVVLSTNGYVLFEGTGVYRIID